MCLHFSNGDKGQALRVYRDCATLFEELFGESSTPTTRALYQAIADDDPVAYELERWTGGLMN
jgi:DNA-binding SARP family transcriptional activator